MKRVLCFLVLISLVLSSVLVITSCRSEKACCDNPVETTRRNNYVAPTCVNEGQYTLVTSCGSCRKEWSRKTVILPPDGKHIAGEKIIENEGTEGCTSCYDEVTLCKNCLLEISRTHIFEDGKHTPAEPQRVEGKAAECETDGYYYMETHCADCGKLLYRDIHNIIKTGHVGNVGEACGECGEVISDTTHTSDIYWDTPDTFIFSLTENSNGKELPSTCARYIAGDTKRGIPEGERADYIDDLVKARNEDAIAITGVSPRYTYIPEDNEHRIGGNVNQMVIDALNYTEGKTPDVYCNFVYDMVSASLLGAFANLKTSTLETDGEVRKNFFRFADPTFVDSGKGYMVEYMRSLSLSRNKQYCLASDYFTDLVRAFFVVPVSINLLETFPLTDEEGKFNYDYISDGEYTIEDFYQFVYTGNWSYDTLIEISEVYSFYEGDGVDDTDNLNGDLNDRLIFAVSESSELAAAGMLYTTSVTVIEREPVTIIDENGNSYTDYKYYYPSSTADPHFGKDGYIPANQSLYDFCDAVTDLMTNHKGIISVSNSEELGWYPGNALLAIRNRFVNNQILFGGIVTLGSLEYPEYTGMTDGFGVVPVPLFRTESADGDDAVWERYMTQIHNLCRIGGINARTTKFAKISAYLDYVSMNSTDILEEYYEYELCGDVAGAGAHKVMLYYIRMNVRTSFDKAFEDAIGHLIIDDGNNSPEAIISAEQQKWHSLIKNNGFDFNALQMRMMYDLYLKSKATRLAELERLYEDLPS